jgi:hypothetical protein
MHAGDILGGNLFELRVCALVPQGLDVYVSAQDQVSDLLSPRRRDKRCG